MREIPLTKGYVAIVDDEDFERFGHMSWHALVRAKGHPGGAYAVAKVPMVNAHYHLHRLIMDAPVGMFVDHINRDTMDNRRQNLRLCTHAQNMWNTARPLAASGFRNVHWCKRKRRYYYDLVANGVTYRKRGFTTAEAAARARDEVAKRVHGEFAVLNFPEGASSW